MKNRFSYIVPIVATIFFGLASRKFSAPTSWVFLYVGDALYATLFYFIFRFLFIHKKLSVNAFLAVVWCFCIEFFQLYQSPWINDIRATIFGKLILGSGFLWSDLVCYLLGVLLGLLLDVFLHNIFKKQLVKTDV